MSIREDPILTPVYIESTPLSQSLSEQGIKIRIRKDVRNRPRALIAPLPLVGTANEAGAEDVARADESLPKAGAKRKGAPGKKNGAAKPNPRKRARTNPEAPSGIGNDTPSVPPFPTFNAPPITQDYSHLPPPSIPGGVPIDVPYHPDILVRHDEQPAPSSTTAGDGGVQSAAPIDGADRNAQMTYAQPPPHSLPNTRGTSGASAQPPAYTGQWAQIPQPQLPAPGQPFPPHSQVPPQVMGAPSYAYSTQQAAMDTMPPSHVSASHPMQPYPHVPIPHRPTEYAQPPSASTNPMRPSQFPSGPISPQTFIPPPQSGLDYRHRSHSHPQQPPLAHSHQRVSSFGQPAQSPQGCSPYAAYQAQTPYPQSHSGYGMSPVGMSGPPSTLTSPTSHEDISSLASTRSTALPSSAAYLSLSPADLESTYRPPHPHGGGGAYPPGPGPSPTEAALQGHAYTTQQQTGYDGYRTSSIFLGVENFN